MNNPIPKDTFEKYEPFNYPVSSTIKLRDDFKNSDRNFIDVLLSRRSSDDVNYFNSHSIDELLFYSAKIQLIGEDISGFPVSKRAAPSAGARHPIDLLISMPEKNSVRELSIYNPMDHSLGKLSIPNRDLELFFREVNNNKQIKDACLIWFSIQYQKTSSKYFNPESLYWKDVGAFLYCIQIVATYLKMKSCPLGTLASQSFPKLFNTEKLISGGGILVG